MLPWGLTGPPLALHQPRPASEASRKLPEDSCASPASSLQRPPTDETCTLMKSWTIPSSAPSHYSSRADQRQVSRDEAGQSSSILYSFWQQQLRQRTKSVANKWISALWLQRVLDTGIYFWHTCTTAFPQRQKKVCTALNGVFHFYPNAFLRMSK